MDAYDTLGRVDSSKMSWRLRVRVTRCWTMNSLWSNKIIAYNLILLDNDNLPVHAIITPAKWNSLDHPIVEGNVYEIANFVARIPVGKIRPVQTPKCLLFTPVTSVNPITEPDVSIPVNCFKFISLDNLNEHAPANSSSDMPIQCIDLIGVVENPGQIFPIDTKSGPRIVHSFNITNGKKSFPVRVWEQHQSSSNVLFNDNLDTPVVVVIASARVMICQSSLSVSTMLFSKVHINLDIKESDEMRQIYEHNVNG